jgi:hypothetical protein
MADNMVAGLFGLTPEMYGEQQRRSALNEGITLAQLSPSARGTAMIYGGAKGLGSAIGGLMGVEDPQMKLISARQQIIGRLDQTNPTSMLEGAKMLAQMGDQQGAFALADYARKAQSEIAQAQQRLAAAGRERQQAVPNDIQIANEIATLTDAQDQLKNQPASPERDRAMNMVTTRLTQLERLTTKPEKDLRFGTDREAISSEVYDKPFAQLTPSERAVVNKRVEDEQGRKAEKGAAKLTNVMPGQKDLADIPKFRADVQKTIAPQIQSVTAADQALQAINDSIASNNFVSFNAARVQLAKALGDSQLSRRDVEQAGGDPSLFGRMLDSTSTLFTGTPTLETQNLIKNTLSAIKKVSTDKANREINVQRNIAYSTPGYDRARVDAALKFPEFEATTTSPISGDVAAQARAILEQRKKGSK